MKQFVNYDSMSGTEFEGFCAELLRSNGYYDVFLTQGSGDFSTDILAKKDGTLYVFQCKCYSNNVGIEAVNQAIAAREYRKADFGVAEAIGIAVTNRYFTNAAIEMANKTNIQLWDRDVLSRMINKTGGKEYICLTHTDKQAIKIHGILLNSGVNGKNIHMENQTKNLDIEQQFEKVAQQVNEVMGQLATMDNISFVKEFSKYLFNGLPNSHSNYYIEVICDTLISFDYEEIHAISCNNKSDDIAIILKRGRFTDNELDHWGNEASFIKNVECWDNEMIEFVVSNTIMIDEYKQKMCM